LQQSARISELILEIALSSTSLLAIPTKEQKLLAPLFGSNGIAAVKPATVKE
jgi:hypothetical protein